MTSSPTIVWFYRDLRLHDNVALSWAAVRGPIIPLYIYDDCLKDGGASQWWLQESLKNFAHDLSHSNIPLILKRGKSLEVLRALLKQSGAKSVCWARRYEPDLAARDTKIADLLSKDGIEISIHSGFLLFEPEQIKTQSGSAFKVFTPFSKACFAAAPPAPTLPAPKKITGVSDIQSDKLEAWKLVPKASKWPKGLDDAWSVSEQAASQNLHKFIKDRLQFYKTNRDRPDILGTSRLSPYLHFGQLSPRQIWHAIMHAQLQSSVVSSSAERYLLELLWREFSWHLLHHIPDLTTQPLQKSFSTFPWREDKKGLDAWQKGQTGYPIIDASMRELWQTGWMHNRMRMIAASFLIKDLLIDWRIGMAWFWDTLVDADLGSNTASWQWVAGCGADAAPYFRIFNPILQGTKFDPKGEYVKKFVPELSKLDVSYIHEPWKAPASVLAKAGIVLGKTYPLPIIDHAKARDRALRSLKASKGQAGQTSEIEDLFD